jgi:phosphate/sulfate permease
MITPKKPDWQITMLHVGTVVLVVPLAVGVALIVWKLSFWRLISSTLGLIFFTVAAIVFAVVFYSILEWYWNRPAQLSKRIPISSKELRRRTKQFYDDLPKT